VNAEPVNVPETVGLSDAQPYVEAGSPGSRDEQLEEFVAHVGP
jgi:hypothetical protein